jgi:hypothetical protein
MGSCATEKMLDSRSSFRIDLLSEVCYLQIKFAVT